MRTFLAIFAAVNSHVRGDPSSKLKLLSVVRFTHTENRSSKPDFKLTSDGGLLLQSVAAMEALRDPKRADLVALLTSSTSLMALGRLSDRMLKQSVGRQLLQERRCVTEESLEAARRCRAGTFGNAYAKFMDVRSFTPADRPTDSHLGHKQVNYTKLRISEIHDFLHVIFNCPTTIEGEILIKTIEFVNFQLPLSGLAALYGQYQASSDARERLCTELLSWAVRAGLKCKPLEGIDYESHFTTPLDEFRRMHSILELQHQS